MQSAATRCTSCEQRRPHYRDRHNTSPIWRSADCVQIEQPADDEDGRRGL